MASGIQSLLVVDTGCPRSLHPLPRGSPHMFTGLKQMMPVEELHHVKDTGYRSEGTVCVQGVLASLGWFPCPPAAGRTQHALSAGLTSPLADAQSTVAPGSPQFARGGVCSDELVTWAPALTTRLHETSWKSQIPLLTPNNVGAHWVAHPGQKVHKPAVGHHLSLAHIFHHTKVTAVPRAYTMSSDSPGLRITHPHSTGLSICWM